MTYTLVIPPDILDDLARIRAATGISIRRQVLDASRAWISEYRQKGPAAHAVKSFKEVKP